MIALLTKVPVFDHDPSRSPPEVVGGGSAGSLPLGLQSVRLHAGGERSQHLQQITPRLEDCDVDVLVHSEDIQAEGRRVAALIPHDA